jgi:hypothetical protein
MFKPLQDTAEAFQIARDDYLEASREQNAEAAIDALVRAVASADAILVHLGYVEPYECGDCEGCKAAGAARREEMQAAVENDPDLSTSAHGALLSDEDNAAARTLLASVFNDPAGDEDAATGAADSDDDEPWSPGPLQ